MSQLKTNSIVDASGGNTATINGVAPNVNNIRGKNKIINGNFDVWQRGTGAFTADEYTADRWVLSQPSSTASVSQSSFTLGQTDVPNEPKHYITTTVTTASTAGSACLLDQRVENVRTLAGQTATLSFWAKADASKDIAVEFKQDFGTGGSPSADVTAIGVTTCALTTSWQKFEVTVSIPSISGKTLGSNNNDHLQLIFWLEAGSDFNARTNSLGNQSGTFDIAQVQLEAGDTASGFETLSYGETLAMCQRYYYVASQNLELFSFSGANSGASRRLSFARPVTMRDDPTESGTLSNVTGTLNFTGTTGIVRLVATSVSPLGNSASIVDYIADAEL